MGYEFYKKVSDVWGLSYIPILKNYSMDADGPLTTNKSVPNPYGFQDVDKEALKDEILRLNNRLRCVLEIGVCSFREEEIAKGSTYVILDNKPTECIYIGVDVSDHGDWIRQYKNSHFIVCDSENENVIAATMKKLGVNEIDLYLIDGWHSVNRVLKEWQYTKWLSSYGSVVMHDISCHPCSLVFDAIDSMNPPIVRQVCDKFKISNIKTTEPCNISAIKNQDLLFSLFVGFFDGDGTVTKRNGVIRSIAIKTHAAWLANLSLFEKFIYYYFENSRRYSTNLARLNSRGYALLMLSDLSLVAAIKRKVLEFQLPVMQRKWDLIDENWLSKNEKKLIRIKNKITLGYALEKIAFEEGVKKKSLKIYLKKKDISWQSS